MFKFKAQRPIIIQRFYRNDYQYFNQRKPKFNISNSTRNLLISGACLGLLYYSAHQDYAPYSNRRRFIAISREFEASLGAIELQSIVREYKNRMLDYSHPIAKTVAEVARPIIAASDIKGFNWEIFVIDEPIQNAFVLPGGKIFVFTGILRAANTKERLAAVLSHEIAHQVARHSAEGITYRGIVSLLFIGIRLVFEPPHGLTELVRNLFFNVQFI